MTPEQRAVLVAELKRRGGHSGSAEQLEADGVTIATLTAERDAAQAEIARLTADLTSGASPDTIAKSDDFVSLPRAEVEALIETITIQCGLLTMGCGGVQHRIDITVARMIKALATLQERMK